MPDPDYIIVGGGSAGCALASRLSEESDVSVVLLEAGGEADHWTIRLPAALGMNFLGGPFNWSYSSVPQKNLAGRRIYQPRGKVLGGSLRTVTNRSEPVSGWLLRLGRKVGCLN